MWIVVLVLKICSVNREYLNILNTNDENTCNLRSEMGALFSLLIYT
jgi:hypothetical protein